MVTTLNHDAFDNEPIDPLPYNILYGTDGWTDEIDSATLESLVKIGVIRLLRRVAGPGFETRIYVSTKGREPQ